MAKMRKILALVLVMAMTFSMLPIFAAAEEAVGEVAAVETVEAPAAEAPVVEAPAAEAPAADAPVVDAPVVDAPVAEIPAVEDVAEIPAETPADVPVVEAIETVATEAVAELQDDVTDPVAMVYPLVKDAKGFLVCDTDNGVGYATLEAAFTAARTATYLTEIVVLKDIVIYDVASAGNFSGVMTTSGQSVPKAYPTYNTENVSDLDTPVKGFWLNMNDKTLTVNSCDPLFYIEGSIPLNIKNGRIIYAMNHKASNADKPLFKFGYYNNRDADETGGFQQNASGDTGENKHGYNRHATVTLKDMEIYRVATASSTTVSAEGALAAGPIFGNYHNESTINVIDSKLINQIGSVFYYKKSTSKSGYNTAGLPYEQNINVYGESVIGSSYSPASLTASLCSAIYVATKSTSGVATTGNTVTMKVYGSDAKFLGASGIFNRVSGGAAFAMKDGTDAELTYGQGTAANYNIPDVAAIAAIKETAYGSEAPAIATAVSALTYATAAHVHNRVHVEAVPATEATIGFAEHYYCAGCAGYFTADEDTAKTTRTALALPVLSCVHENLTEQPATAATFLATGNTAYWSCPDCGKYFSDADAKVEVEEGSWVIAKRATTDTAGLVTDKDFADLGAVAITIDPDGTTIAYTGSTAINDAYKHGATWTEAGGIVKLVCDYTHWDKVTREAKGVINTGASAANACTYEIADKKDYPEELDIKGFWLDLGNHTLVVRTSLALFASTAEAPFNVRNGRIIHQFTTAQTSAYAMFKHGTTAGGTAVGGPRYTFDNVEMIKVGNSALSNNGGAMFYMNMLQSTINIIDSKIISDRGSPLVQCLQGSSVVTTGTNNPTVPYRHEVNIYGDSVVGTLATGEPVFAAATSVVGNNHADDGIYLNIAEDADVKFLGTTLTEFPATIAAKGDFVTKKYVLSDEKFTGYTMPDTSKFVDESGPATVVDLETTVSCNLLEPAAEDTTFATYTSNDGTVTLNTTLSGAYAEWEKTHSGKITLTDDVTEDQARVVQVYTGDLATYYKSFTGSGDSITVNTNAIFLLKEDASNGDLTIDLNGKTVNSPFLFVAMDFDLAGFDLSIENGSVTTNTANPLLSLNGSNNTFKLDGATLTHTSTTANSAWVINDTRYGGSYSVLTESTLSSAHGSAIALVATEKNKHDATLMYYIDDCSISGHYLATWSPAAIAKITSVGPKADTNTDGVTARDGYTVILDNTTVATEGSSKLTNLAANDGIFTESAPAGDANVVASATGDARIGELKFNDIGKALAYAEFFGRKMTAASVKLEKNISVDKSYDLGTTGAVSTFTLDLNGKKLEGAALVNPTGGAGTKVTINLTGKLGNDDQMIKIFANADETFYLPGDAYVIQKGRYFTNYSLNLEENVTINLYTDGENGKPAKVYYLLDGVRKDAVPGSANEWMITELAAKDMGKTVDAYAFETVDGTTYVDFSKNISVAGYVDTKPGEDETDANVQETLNKTLDTMMIYGELANRFFNGNFAALTEDETKALIGKDAAAIDTTNLVDTPRAVSQTIPNRAEDNSLKAGYWGTSAVLEDSISIKMYFYGAMFNDVTAKVKYGDGSYAAADLVTQESGFKFVKTSVAAKDFDTAITVALFDGEGAEIGTVTDSVSSYTSRIGATENAYNLAQALRAYGADAKRYAEAKGAAADAT